MRHYKILSLIIFSFFVSCFLVIKFLSAQAFACNFHNISGWIWNSNIGWISLNCNNTVLGSTGFDYGVDINFESGSPTEPVIGYAWSSNAGWIDFQPSGPYPSAPFHSARFNRNLGESPTTTAGKITGWAKFASHGEEGWMKLGPIEISGTDYGVEVDSSRFFKGWSWNASNTSNLGFGWTSWGSPGSYGAEIVTYWFETLYGNIYSKGRIDASFAPPLGKFTATYLIQADGTINPVNITSLGGDSVPYRSENFGPLTFPQLSNNYYGTLGKLDKEGIINGYYGKVNSYAQGAGNSNAVFGANKLLNGEVYSFPGNLIINGPLTFLRGSGSQNASGTIIVEGNLQIQKNIYYQSGSISSRIENLPSVAWIVKGNINISPSVTEIAGVFYSEGSGGIKTGTTGSSETDEPLVIYGMIMAKKINLERIPIQAGNPPGEQIIFDGRAMANPPPGLVDMIKGLPTFREVIPQ